MSRFAEGFYEYLKEGVLSDVTLKLNGETYKAHRIILSYSSEFFVKLFSSRFKEVIQLKFKDPKNVFPLILRFMYEGQLEITDENVIALLTASEQYFIPTLHEQCDAYIENNLGKDTAISYLKDAIEFSQAAIERSVSLSQRLQPARLTLRRCIDTIAANFLWLTEKSIPDFSWLYPATMEELLKNPRLAVSNEYSVYQTVVQYIDTHPELTDDQVAKLAKHIRFRWLSSKQLLEALHHSRIPNKYLVKGTFFRLHEVEGMASMRPPVKMTRRYEKRRWLGVQLEWDRTGPSLRGILHWLGTRMGTRPFQNPAQSGLVRVTASSLAIGTREDIVGLYAPAQRVWTQDVPASWICIDLINWAIKPSGYSLRHGGDYRADALRNWDFQGSNNGKTWQLLKRHSVDNALDGPHAVHTWPVVGAEEPYTSFRIIQTGQNSSNHNFLVVAGIELFGEVWEKNCVKYYYDLCIKDKDKPNTIKFPSQKQEANPGKTERSSKKRSERHAPHVRRDHQK